MPRANKLAMTASPRLRDKLAMRLAEGAPRGPGRLLRPDGKSQVSIEYDGSVPRRVEPSSCRCQHADSVAIEELPA